MKNLYQFLTLLLLSFSGLAVAQIPNNGFEDWTSMGSYMNPTGWGTLNDAFASYNVYTATKGTPGNPGNSYLKLTSTLIPGKTVVPGIAVSGNIDGSTYSALNGFPYNQRPQKLTGKWQFMAYGSDQGYIGIYLTKWNTATSARDTVAFRKYALPGMVMSWGTFNIPLTYLTGDFPDTALIILSASGASPYQGSYLYVDNITFSGTVAGIDEISESGRMDLVLNPTKGDIQFSSNLNGLRNVVITLFDLSGKQLDCKVPRSGLYIYSDAFSTRNLAKGVYLIRLTSDSVNLTKKVVVQ